MQKLLTSLFRYTFGFSYLSLKKAKVFLYTRARVITIVLITITLATVISFAYGIKNPLPTNAATNDTINFQSRLENSNGAIAPDGNYNVEFKLYSTSSGGSALWTEDYLNSNSQGVRVSNGYLTVNLGSITAFPSTIPWSQQLYLTINIGGTGNSPSWDGEMNPRLLLTSVPYAFQAQNATELQTTSGSNTATLSFTTPSANDTITLPDASGTVCLESSSSCGFALSANDNGYIENGTSLQTGANFDIQSTSTSSATAILEALTSQTADLLTFNNSSGSPLSGVNNSGQLYFQSGSYTGTLAQSSLSGNATYYLPGTSGTQTICTVQSGNCAGSGSGITGSGNSNYVAVFNTNTTLDASTLEYDNGSFVGIGSTTNSGLLSISGQVTSQASLFIQGKSSASAATAIIKAASSQTGDLLDVEDSTGNVLSSINSSGNLFIGNSSNTGQLTFYNNTSSNGVTLDEAAYPTTPATVSLPDASGTVCLDNSSACGFAQTAGSGAAFVNNGNAFGTTAILGTTDSNPLEIEAHSNIGLTVTTAGDVGVNTSSSLNSGTLSVLGQSSQVAEVVQGSSSQDIADFYTSTPTKVAYIDSNGQIYSTLSSATGLNNLNLSNTNSNTSATAATANGATISLTGTNNTHSNANTLNGLNLANVTAATNNTFNALNIGTGFSNILEYNSGSLINGAGILQNAAIGSSTNYSNLDEIGTVTSGSIASGFGSISTGNNIATTAAIQGATFTDSNVVTGGGTFNVNSSGNLVLGNANNVGELILENNTTTSGVTLEEASTTGSSVVINIPDTAGTVCLDNSSACGFALTAGGSAAYVQGGNAFGATGVLGTTDSNALNIEAHGNVGITVTTAGYVGIGTTSAIGTTTQLSVQAATGNVGQIIEGSSADATLTNELPSSPDTSCTLTSGDGTDWTYASNVYTHLTGQNDVLTCAFNSGSPVNGTKYEVVYTSAPSVATDTVTSALGGVNGTASTGSVTNYSVLITSSSGGAQPTFTLSSNTDTGTISNIYVYAYPTTATNAVLQVDNSSAVDTLDVRSSGSNTDTFIGLNVGRYNNSSTSYNGTTSGLDNTALGSGSFQSNTLGYNNTAVGFDSLQSNVNGINDTAIGGLAYQANVSSTNGTAVGYEALQSDISGGTDTAIGFGALKSVTTGSSSIALGFDAQFNNNPSSVIAIGYQALYNNTANNVLGVGEFALYNNTGASNVALGYQSQYTNTSGATNTSIGNQSLEYNSTGNQDTVLGYAAEQSTSGTSEGGITGIGFEALDLNTANDVTAVGDQALKNNTASTNSALGYESLETNTSGGNNTAVGYLSLTGNSTGGGNTVVGSSAQSIAATNISDVTALGYDALANNTANNVTGVGYQSLQSNTGVDNSALGYNSGLSNTTGTNNTFVGYDAGYQDSNYANDGFGTLSGLQNAAAIGNYAQVQASNSIVIGSVDTATKVGIGVTVPLNTFSVSPVQDNSGSSTASQTNTTITATSGTPFTSSMTGEEFIWANGNEETVTYLSSSTLTGSVSESESTQSYRLHYIGLQVTSGGDVGVNTSASINSGTLSVLGYPSQVAEVVEGASSQDITDFDNSSASRVAYVDASGDLISTQAVQGATFTNGAGGTFNVNSSGNLSLGNSSNTGELLLYNNTSASPVTLEEAATPSHAYTINIPYSSGISNNYTDSICLVVLANCNGSNAGGGDTNYIYNTAAPTQQANANIDIAAASSTVAETIQGASGKDIADFYSSTPTKVAYIDSAGDIVSTASVLSPLIDSPSGTSTLNIGTNNATSGIDLNQNVTVLSGKTLTVTGTANINTSGSSSTNLGTGTGTVGVGNTTAATTIAGGAGSSITFGNFSATSSTVQGVTIDATTNFSANGTTGAATSCSSGQANLGAAYTEGLLTTAGSCTSVATLSSDTNYIENQYSSTETGNFNIQSASSTAVGAVIEGASSQSANLLNLENSSGASLLFDDASGDQESIGYVDDASGGIGQYGNILTNSETIGGTGWSIQNSETATQAATTAPDGASTATKLTNGGTEFAGAFQTFTTNSAASPYTFSFWAKSGNSSKISYGIYDYTTSAFICEPTVTNLTSTWQRYSCTGTPSSGQTLWVYIYADGATSVTSGNYNYVWGAQVVQASTPEVYTATVGSTISAGSGIVTEGSQLTGSTLTFGQAGGATIQQASGQSLTVGIANNADLLTIQGNASSTFSATNSTGTTALGFAAPTTSGTVTYQLPAGGTGGSTYGICTTYTVCSGYAPSSGGTGYVQLAPASVQADSSTNSSIFINKTGSSGNILELQKSASDVFDVGNTGNIIATGTYNTNTFTSSALTFGAASAATIQSASSQGLTVSAGSSGNAALTVQGTSSSSIAFGSGTTQSFAVSATHGVITIQGGNSIDLTTPTISTSTTTPNSLTIQPGINNYCNSGSCDSGGANLNLYSGDATGYYYYCTGGEDPKCFKTYSEPGNINIDTGTSLSGSYSLGEGFGGDINIGATNANYITIGNASGSGDATDTDLQSASIEIGADNDGDTTATDLELQGDTINIGTDSGASAITIGENTVTGYLNLTTSTSTLEVPGTDTLTIQTGGTGTINLGSGSTATLNLGTGGENTINIGKVATATPKIQITGANNSFIYLGGVGCSNTYFCVDTSGDVDASGLITGTDGATIYGNNISLNGGSSFNTSLDAGASTGSVYVGDSGTSNSGNTQVINVGYLTVAGTTNVNIGATSSSTAGTTSIYGKSGINITGGTGSSAVSVQTGASGTILIGTSASSTVQIGNSTAGNVSLTSSSSNKITLQSGATTQTISNTGNTTQTSTNSSTAFQIQNADGEADILANTTATTNYILDADFANGSGSTLNDWTKVGSPTTYTQNTIASNTYEGQTSLEIVYATGGASQGVETTASGAGLTSEPTTNNSADEYYTVSFDATEVSGGTAFPASDFTITGVDATGNQTCTGTINGSGSTNISTSGFVRVYCTLQFTSATAGAISQVEITSTTSNTNTFYLDDVQLQLATSASTSAVPTPFQLGNIQLRGVINTPVAIQNVSNSTTAFQIQNTAGTSNLLVADTIDSVIGIDETPSPSGADLQVASGGISTTGTIQGGTVYASSSFEANVSGTPTAGLNVSSCGSNYALVGSTFTEGILTSNTGCSSGTLCTSATDDCGTEDGNSESWIIGLNTPTYGTSGTECGTLSVCTIGTSNNTSVLLQADNNENLYLTGDCTVAGGSGTYVPTCDGVFSAGYNSTILTPALNVSSTSCVGINTTCGSGTDLKVYDSTSAQYGLEVGSAYDSTTASYFDCVAVDWNSCSSADDFAVKAIGAGSIAFTVQDSTGCVTINTQTCTEGEKLAVSGKVVVNSAVYATAYDAYSTYGSLDYAEYDTATNPSTVNAADLVSNDPNNPGQIILSQGDYDSNLIGVISTSPAYTANGEIDPSTGNVYSYLKPLALAGRVPVNVTGENGPIEPGDYITASDTPGYGMNATEPGEVVGMALTGFNGTSSSDTGQVTVEVENFFYTPSVSTMLQGENQLTNMTLTGNTNISGNLSIGDSNGGISISASSTNPYEPILYGTARHHIGITLSPQYSGAIVGSNPSGTMINGICQNSSVAGGLNINTIPNINSCPNSGEGHTYYAWTTNQSGSQSNDIYVRYELPSNFSAWATSNPVELTGFTSNHNNDSVTLSMYAPNGQLCGSSTPVNTQDGQWQTTALGGFDGSNFTNCDNLTAGSTVTIQVHLSATTDDYAIAGDININYLSSY